MNEKTTNTGANGPLPRRDHEYDDWTVISFADSVGLFRGTDKLDRADYPEGFDRYLPEGLTPQNTQYRVAKFPGMKGDFSPCVKMYLGPAWGSGIADDLQARSLVGNREEICDNRRTVSAIPDWNLVEVKVRRDKNDTRIAELYFEKEGGGDQVRAEWSWGGMP